MDEKKIKAIFGDLLKEHLSSFKKEINKELGELKKSVQYISDSFDEQKKAIEKLFSETKQLTEDKAAMTLKIQELENRINEIEQQKIEKNIIIGGIPKQENKSLTEVVQHVARSMQIEIKADSICETYRLGKHENAPVLVKLSSHKTKIEFFQKVKQMKGIDTHVCGLNGNSKIYINEDLTPHIQKLFKKAMEIKKQKNFYSVFTRNGKILLKKTRTEAPVKILCEQDLKL
ncbi:uncharacterized protein LOC126892822 [Diabrotica virgifera virgifera]|uniref:Uncharacterized protein LOC114338083 n=1 Tax=Diabrotica virgifera virgifera TaxID=50390 RepID=A0A6P7G605_DIAVI|nr:uncharacterized protein LOC126880953 [Diabrotica virgifera virgifera]XP_050505252.1 uncharacterized protein LOC126883639 [Diabrotica virgifera virgifera]XP_050518517.1 uncharacterized protein LOC126892822 [Diabrotica virgifera virgifera]